MIGMVVMANGTIGVLKSSEEDWKTYIERVKLYLAAIKIMDAGQK